jgi:hypothetical protein
LYHTAIPITQGAGHGNVRGAEAGQESATAETGGGAEATGRDVGGKPARAGAPGRRAPVQNCFLTESVFDIGMGTLVLARGASRHYVALSSFLIDVFCLGIKDGMFGRSEVFEMYMDATDAGSPMISVDPSYASKLLRELAVWSQSIGFAERRDLVAVERIFGDVSADASDAVFRFGRDGKPVYIPGPTDTAHLIRRRIEQLQKSLGDDGFGLETAA